MLALMQMVVSGVSTRKVPSVSACLTPAESSGPVEAGYS